jgi:hypothetical protein
MQEADKKKLALYVGPKSLIENEIVETCERLMQPNSYCIRFQRAWAQFEHVYGCMERNILANIKETEFEVDRELYRIQGRRLYHWKQCAQDAYSAYSVEEIKAVIAKINDMEI